jgi:hypothetical protein
MLIVINATHSCSFLLFHGYFSYVREIGRYNSENDLLHAVAFGIGNSGIATAAAKFFCMTRLCPLTLKAFRTEDEFDLWFSMERDVLTMKLDETKDGGQLGAIDSKPAQDSTRLQTQAINCSRSIVTASLDDCSEDDLGIHVQ